MKTQHLILAGLAPLFLAACATGPSAEQQAQYAADARASAGKLLQSTLGELKTAIETVGPEQAITICRDRVPQIAGKVAKEDNITVKRVTTKLRNPKRSTPDVWEEKALRTLEQQLASGVNPQALEYYEVVYDKDGNKVFRYARGLVTGELCMICHGTNVPESVKAVLAKEYPNDKATGYEPKQFRGAISIQRKL